MCGNGSHSASERREIAAVSLGSVATAPGSLTQYGPDPAVYFPIEYFGVNAIPQMGHDPAWS